ncbi:hypothetical protein N7G274_005090 [Stereocaulon virgatum]|uniref:F-box domain-containing protein n=1 Tax=Stereocaulon virgatum TaxID=373712 RepID=A0ABR4AET4_9LECA
MEASLYSEELPDQAVKRQPFRFFDLPVELRAKILGYLLFTDRVVDLDPNHHRLAHQCFNLFLVSRRFLDEASHLFYSGNAFRIFPTHGRFFGHKTRPLLSRLSSRYRASLVSLELRLGPGWSSPPRSWRVHDALGLEEMAAVRILKVFVECDPSHEIFRGFRIGKNFYTDFSVDLLEGIVERLPALERVEFDGWPSVMREGPLMRRLVEVAELGGKKVVQLTPRESREEICRALVLRARNVYSISPA